MHSHQISNKINYISSCDKIYTENTKNWERAKEIKQKEQW